MQQSAHLTQSEQRLKSAVVGSEDPHNRHSPLAPPILFGSEFLSGIISIIVKEHYLSLQRECHPLL